MITRPLPHAGSNSPDSAPVASWARVSANARGPAASSTRIPSSRPPVRKREPLATSGGSDTMM
jgi:hypothetical protein